VENENNNTLKNQGYDLAHNYGHGDEYLSQNICTLNILAFLFHTVQDFSDENYIELRSLSGTRKKFFGHLDFLTTTFIVQSFDKMIEFLLVKRKNIKNIDIKEYLVI